VTHKNRTIVITNLTSDHDPGRVPFMARAPEMVLWQELQFAVSLTTFAVGLER